MDLQNSSALDVNCRLKMQVTLDKENDVCLIERVLMEAVSLRSGESRQHTIDPVIRVL